MVIPKVGVGPQDHSAGMTQTVLGSPPSTTIVRLKSLKILDAHWLWDHLRAKSPCRYLPSKPFHELLPHTVMFGRMGPESACSGTFFREEIKILIQESYSSFGNFPSLTIASLLLAEINSITPFRCGLGLFGLGKLLAKIARGYNYRELLSSFNASLIRLSVVSAVAGIFWIMSRIARGW